MNLRFENFYLYIVVIVLWLSFVSISLVVKLVDEKYGKEKKHAIVSKKLLYEILSFSFLGLTIGYMVGLTKNQVIEAFVPALLTFLSGFLIYLYSKDNTLTDLVSMRATSAIFFLSIAIYLGAVDGAYTRVQSESILRERKHRMELEIREIDYLLNVDSKNNLDSSSLEFRNYLYEKFHNKDFEDKEVISLDQLKQSIGN